MKILFLGETYRADALTWIRGIEKQSNVRISTMEVPFSAIRLRRLLNFLVFLFEIIRSRSKGWDIVLAERSTSYGFFSLLVNAKIRVVAQQGITDAYPETGFTGLYKRFLQRLVYRNADLIHAWGNVMTYAMIECGASPSKIMVLPKGINLNLYTCENSPKAIDQTPVGIVTRSLSSIYNHQDILASYRILKDRGIHVICWIVGDGVKMNSLVKKAEELGISDRVVFWGRIDNNMLPDKLRKSTFYLAVPETEGVSASLFEAMATCCFPIVTDLPANRAFIRQGKNGFLVKVNDPTDLADAIEKFVRNPSLFSGEIQSNRVYVEEFVNFDENMKLIYRKYLSLLERKNVCVE